MPSLVEQVRERLAPLDAEVITLTDDSHRHAGHAGNNGGGHLSLTIVSQAFSGLSTVTRHRKIYGLVSDLMPHTLHALVITAKAPDEQ